MEIYNPSEDSFLLSSVLEKEIPKLLKKNKDLKFLEMGTGSGIQLKTAVKSGIKKQNIFSCDVNSSAVSHCKALGFNSVVSDLFENIKGRYNIIILNPPYLPLDSREPKDSRVSTTGGKKGSEIINRFLKQTKKHLTKDGKIFILISSLTKGTDFKGFRKKTLAKQKLFFEELFVFELTPRE
jgi:release factor glutamine methyltransferase